MPHDDERELRRFLDEAHGLLDGRPPSFQATLATARRRAAGRGPRLRRRWRVAAVAALVALTVVGLGLLGQLRTPALDSPEALLLAETLSSWEGPTDFLRRPPGTELLETLPRVNRTFLLTKSSEAAATWAAEEMEETP